MNKVFLTQKVEKLLKKLNHSDECKICTYKAISEGAWLLGGKWTGSESLRLELIDGEGGRYIGGEEKFSRVLLLEIIFFNFC